MIKKMNAAMGGGAGERRYLRPAVGRWRECTPVRLKASWEVGVPMSSLQPGEGTERGMEAREGVP